MVYTLNLVGQQKAWEGALGSESVSDGNCISDQHIRGICNNIEPVKLCKSQTCTKETNVKKMDDEKFNGIAELHHAVKVTGTGNPCSDFEGFSDSSIQGQFTDPQHLFNSEDFTHFIEFSDNDRNCPVEWKTFEGNIWSNEEHKSAIYSGKHISEHFAPDDWRTTYSTMKDYERTEDLIKHCFPAVPVQYSTESVKRLDQLFDINSDKENEAEQKRRQSCIRPLDKWRFLQDEDSTVCSVYPWKESHCQEVLLSTLGINPNMKNFSEGAAHLRKDVDQEDSDDLQISEGLNCCDSKALIQTKLSEAPCSGRGKNLTYHVFVNWTQVNGSRLSLTVPNDKRSFFFK